MANKKPNASEQALEKAAQAGGVTLRDPADASTYRILNRTQEGVEKAMQIFTHNLRGQKLTERNLPRVTVPPNGITLWTVPGTEGDEHHEELTGILVEYTTPRAYWDKPMEPGNTTPPSCSSHDGLKGVGDPGGACYLCPFDKFGTALGESQSGKACKEKRMLFLLRPDSILPLVGLRPRRAGAGGARRHSEEMPGRPQGEAPRLLGQESQRVEGNRRKRDEMTKITHPQGTPIIAHSIVRYQAWGFDTRVQIDELPEGSPYIGLDNKRFLVYKFHAAAVPERLGGGTAYDNISDAIAAAHAYISNT